MRVTALYLQVQSCLAEERCGDGLTAIGVSCGRGVPDTFSVEGRRVVLHLGDDVAKSMSCMIHADGILTGCSTFGQVAGLFTTGLRFFSLGCRGDDLQFTPRQYQMLPPFAVSERGDMWVPVRGSWFDPELLSDRLLEAALDRHLRHLTNRDLSVHNGL